MRYIKAYKLTIVAVVVILIAVLMPADDVPSVGIPNIDKFVHAGMFGGLTLCFYGEYLWNNKILPKLIYSWLGIEGFAMITELLQYFAEGRSTDTKDFIADTIGIILGIIVMTYFVTRRNAKQKGLL